MASTSRIFIIVAISTAFASSSASAQTLSSSTTMLRWGAAAAQLDGLLLLHGGKASTNAGFTYTSAPDSSDLLILNLTQPFALSSPPWTALTTPATASFHTLSPLSRSTFALFGGQDNIAPTPSGNDSLYLLNLADPANPEWTAAATAHPEWNQPMRRMLHSAPSDPISQSLYIVGGERADGSGIATPELWSFSPSTSFAQVVPPPTINIIDGAAPLLADGTIVLVGGLLSPPSSTLAPMDTITSYNPRSQTWSNTPVASPNGNTSYPSPRRAHIAVPLPDNRIFIHGGVSADLSTPLSDAWVLDWSSSPPTWSPVQSMSSNTADSAPTARFAHSAVSYGNNVLLGFGWAGNIAAETSLWVWDGTQARIDSSSGSMVGGVWIGAGSDQGTSSGGVGNVGSYTPDPNAQPLSNGLGWSGSSSPSSGSHKPSGNSPSPSNGQSDPPTATRTRPSPSSTKSGGAEGKDGSTSAGAKAGIILGMLMGLGLAAGAGYYAFRAYQSHHHPSYHGGGGYGKAGLLLGNNNSGDTYDEEDAFTRRRAGGAGGMWGTGAATAAAVGGFLSSSLGGKGKRGREEMGDHEALMLEKGRYQHLGDGPSGYPSPTGAVLGSPAMMENTSSSSRRLVERGMGLGVGERHLPPIGPRGPKALTRNEYYNNAVEEAERQQKLQILRNVREMENSDASVGAGGVIPMAGLGALAAANAGVKSGVRDKIARLVGGRSQAGLEGFDGVHHSSDAIGGGAAAAAMVGGGGRGNNGPRRLDILADEDADEELLRKKYPKQFGAGRAMVDPFADHRGIHSSGGVEEEVEDDDEAGLLGRGRGYGGYAEEEGDEYLDGPRRGKMYAEPEYRVRPSFEDGADGYVVSPFEDDAAAVNSHGPRQPVSVRPILNFRGSTLISAPERESVESSRSGAANDLPRRSQLIQTAQQPALFSNIINMPASSSGAGGMNVAWVDGVGGAAGDAAGLAHTHGPTAHGGGGGDMMVGPGERDDGARSPNIRRSATWWDRFMATSFLDRSSSGAIKAPTAVDPIRDPRRLNESTTSLGTVSESLVAGGGGSGAEEAGELTQPTVYYNPFGDEHGAEVDQSAQQPRSSRPKLGRLNSALEGGGNPFTPSGAAPGGAETPGSVYTASTQSDSMYAATATSTTMLPSTATTSATSHSSHGHLTHAPAIIAPPRAAVGHSKSTRVRTRSNSPTRTASTSSKTHASRSANKLGGGGGGGRSLHKPASVSSLSTTGNGSIYTSNSSDGAGGDVRRGPSGKVRRTIGRLGGPDAPLYIANPDREGSMRSSEGL
ncbi:hypothetical protein A4X13_0g4015 [Tilletia indica]|uniref:Uncharacterized protein n=1 Tax=Tilletia indica TaxID=43049 RepID=A0A177TR04_9BASI|nr:hypothetical protein A4X13_0g4015 [Tilletia indica]